jgi:hypothetical protein
MSTLDRNPMKWLMAALALLILSPAVADEWHTYTNERFGSTADVPGDWRPGEPPVNGDGLEFTSPDGQASIIVSGALNNEGTTDEAMAIYGVPNEGEVITYSRHSQRSIVVSGTRGDRIFYRKTILSCRALVWNSVSLEYPASEKKAFDGLVTRVANSLRSGRSEQIPECGG